MGIDIDLYLKSKRTFSFWNKVLDFFEKYNDQLNNIGSYRQLDMIISYFEHAYHDLPNFSLKGRTLDLLPE